MLQSSPLVVGSALYVGSNDGNLYAFDTGTHTMRWHFRSAAAIVGSPAYGINGRVFVGSTDGSVYALSTADGHELWRFPAGAEVVSVSADFAGNCFAGGKSGKLYRLDGTHGTVLWPFDPGADVQWASPAVIVEGTDRQTVYVANTNSFLALDAASGAVRWPSPAWFRSQYALDAAVVPNGTLYVSIADSNGSSLVAASSATGALKWQWPAGTAALGAPAVGVDGTVFVASVAGIVYAIR